MKFFAYFFLISFLILACKQDRTSNLNLKSEKKFEYIEILAWHESDAYVEIHSGGTKLIIPKHKLPLKTAMVVPTSALAYLNELNLLETIQGVSQIDFVYNPKIQEMYSTKNIIEIGNFNELFVEQILLENPDIFITTSSPSLAKYHEQLKNNGIPILYIDEYEEKNPLAKAEYIKVLGRLFGKEKEAVHIFEEIESNYELIKETISTKANNQPKILVNHLYSDVWYLPTGNSFQAKLIADAGGDYPWKNTEGKTTLNLSFESVFEQAEKAEIWINAGDFSSKDALLASFPHYQWFESFQNDQVYNWYKRSSTTGGNDYFETGTARPDYVLEDLAAIFHPELFPNYELKFYQKLK